MRRSNELSAKRARTRQIQEEFNAVAGFLFREIDPIESECAYSE